MRVTEHGMAYGKNDQVPYVAVYEQPRLNRVIYKVYHWYDMRAFKVPGFKLIERLDRKLHNRKCNDDCGDWHRPGCEETFKACAHVPLSARQDIRCYGLETRNRKLISHVEGDPEPGGILGHLGDRRKKAKGDGHVA